MNLVDKVKIGYKDYKINMVNGNVVDGAKVCYGTIEYNNGNINLSTLHDIEQQKCTLIHECLHGIDDVVEADLTEDQVRLMAKGLYAFIKDNPNLFKEETHGKENCTKNESTNDGNGQSSS